jgi:hypothetical protein
VTRRSTRRKSSGRSSSSESRDREERLEELGERSRHVLEEMTRFARAWGDASAEFWSGSARASSDYAVSLADTIMRGIREVPPIRLSVADPSDRARLGELYAEAGQATSHFLDETAQVIERSVERFRERFERAAQDAAEGGGGPKD